MRLKTINETIENVDFDDQYWYIELENYAKNNPNDEIDVYRVVFGDSKTTINDKGSGYHWTIKEEVLDDPKALRQIFGDDDSFDHYEVIAKIHGKVKLKDINWKATQTQNFNYKNEYEVLVRDPKTVEIIDFKDYRTNDAAK